MNILFLQGLATPFLKHLACLLADQGHTIHKINFCGGDQLFWHIGGKNKPNMVTHAYRGKVAQLPAFYENFINKHDIHAVVLFGDTRPVHEPIIKICRARAIPVHVLEEGYVRPNWITMDMNGANVLSALPRDPDYYRTHYGDKDIQQKIDQSISVGGGFKRRVAMDLALHIANLLAWPLYPRYRTHRPHIVGIEYCGFVLRFLRKIKYGRAYKKRYAQLALGSQSFYLLPLQLDGDSQIRRHCDFSNVCDVLETVIKSFANNAPINSLLGVKLHPLDNGLNNYDVVCAEIAQRHNVADRVLFFEGGSLPDLLRAAQGVVTVNSTVGLSALIHTLKVKTLGRALYDVEGLTYSGALDEFWRAEYKPDAELLDAFRAGLIDQTQINGNFFTHEGIEIGVAIAADKIAER